MYHFLRTMRLRKPTSSLAHECYKNLGVVLVHWSYWFSDAPGFQRDALVKGVAPYQQWSSAKLHHSKLWTSASSSCQQKKTQSSNQSIPMALNMKRTAAMLMIHQQLPVWHENLWQLNHQIRNEAVTTISHGQDHATHSMRLTINTAKSGKNVPRTSSPTHLFEVACKIITHKPTHNHSLGKITQADTPGRLKTVHNP